MQKWSQKRAQGPRFRCSFRNVRDGCMPHLHHPEPTGQPVRTDAVVGCGLHATRYRPLAPHSRDEGVKNATALFYPNPTKLQFAWCLPSCPTSFDLYTIRGAAPPVPLAVPVIVPLTGLSVP